MIEFFNSLHPQAQGTIIGALTTSVFGLVLFLLSLINTSRAARLTHERNLEAEREEERREDWVEFRNTIVDAVKLGRAWGHAFVKLRRIETGSSQMTV